MNNVFVVVQNLDDGSDEILKIFLNKEKAEAYAFDVSTEPAAGDIAVVEMEVE